MGILACFFKLHIILPNNKNSIYKINICAAAEYIETEGRILIEFTRQITPYLTQVKEQFTKYSLKEISQFKSIYTTRLYELIMQYKSSGWIIILVKELRKILGTEKKFSVYTMFKNKTFAYACKEINKIHNLNLRFLEIKEGRKIVKIRFDFNVQSIKLETLEENISTINTEMQEIISDDKMVQTSFLEGGEPSKAEKKISCKRKNSKENRHSYQKSFQSLSKKPRRRL